MEAKFTEPIGLREFEERRQQFKAAESHDTGPALLHQEIDRSIDAFWSTDPSEILNVIDLYLETIEGKISTYEERDCLLRLGKNEDEDAFLYESVTRINKILIKMDESESFRAGSVSKLIRSRASSVLHRAMCFLDEELRAILENNFKKQFHEIPDHEIKTMKSKRNRSFNKISSLSFNTEHHDQVPASPEPGQEFAAFSLEAVCSMNRIVTAMISAGYESECCLLYAARRREAFEAELMHLRFENVAVDDIQRMSWEYLETLITLWIGAVDLCSTNLFAAERELCISVFSDYPEIGRMLFRQNASAVVLRLLSFVDGVVLIKRSSEKLFKLVDIYEKLNLLMIPEMDDETWSDLTDETTAARSRIGEAAMSVIYELESSIKSDIGRTPLPSGAVHPLTRYIMNYLKYTCEYRDVLEKIFHQKQNQNQNQKQSTADGEDPSSSVQPDDPSPIKNPEPVDEDEDSDPEETVFSGRLKRIVTSLEENLEKKSRLYTDPALRSVFLMNNGRYIVKKAQGSKEIQEMLGTKWVRRRSIELHRHHKSYQRETWSRVLQNMKQTGVQQPNGKVSKTALKERFKNFNAAFDEIHKKQSTWVVSDDQMQSELRVSITAVVVPAYRSFLGRFRPFLDRQSEKYIKYLPEDIEVLIEGLFAGNPTPSSISRRRT